MNGVLPWLLIDVDGVVNRARFLSSRERSRLLRGGGWVDCWAGDPHYSERIVTTWRYGPLLKGLGELGMELAWATSWEESANEWIAPLLRLGELPVFKAPYTMKALHVVPELAGRPWAWLDDDEGELETAAELSRHFWPKVPFLPVLIDRATGLTPSHAGTVAAWLGSDVAKWRESL